MQATKDTTQYHNILESSDEFMVQIVLQPIGENGIDPITITDGELTVGRSVEPFNAGPNASRLSREHARLYVEGDRGYVVDLGSLNGTYLNHNKIGSDPVDLTSGDEIDFGGEFQFAISVERQPTDDRTVFELPSAVELCLTPQDSSDLDDLVITRFPFLISRDSQVFEPVKKHSPEAIEKLSRKHALVTLHGDQVFIEDLESSNGTFVGNMRIDGGQPHPIKDGDELRIGVGYFTYRAHVRINDDDRTVIAHPSTGSQGASLLTGSVERVIANYPKCTLDLEELALNGFIVPGHNNDVKEQEFRRIKRQLLSNVRSEHAQDDKIPRSLVLVTSSLDGEGKTYVATNLALSLSTERDYHVLLVEADPQHGGLSRLLGIQDRVGLVDKLAAGDRNVNDCIVQTNVDGLCVMPSGAPVKNLDELFASDLMRQILSDLAKQDANRIVVFDGPSLTTSTESVVLARSMGQTILVVDSTKTPQQTVLDSAAQLAECQCVSTMLNRAPSQ